MLFSGLFYLINDTTGWGVPAVPIPIFTYSPPIDLQHAQILINEIWMSLLEIINISAQHSPLTGVGVALRESCDALWFKYMSASSSFFAVILYSGEFSCAVGSDVSSELVHNLLKEYHLVRAIPVDMMRLGFGIF
jgi:hypothetical protein